MKRWSLPVALAVCIFLKFILFDIIWSSDTTFQSFSQPESYLIKGAIALLLAFPMVFFDRGGMPVSCVFIGYFVGCQFDVLADILYGDTVEQLFSCG